MAETRDWEKEHRELRSQMAAETFKSWLVAIPFLIIFAILRVVLIVARQIIEDKEANTAQKK